MFNVDEKQHLIANLDIEVNHRKSQFKSWLNDHLENFAIHQEGLVSRIPKQVRAMTMRDFGAKYNGNIQAALRGVQREKFVSAGASEIDKSTRKRKWVASQEVEHDASADSQKAPKNARLAVVSPQKKPGSSTGPGTAQRARILAAAGAKTSGMSRGFGSPSPQKSRAPFNTNTSTHSPRPLPRAPISPSKLKQSANPLPRARVPSLVAFNPMVPKTPGYPGGTLRLPRKDESMLSVNGSPIANPYDVWQDGAEGGTGQTRTLKRTKSSITIQRDPSFSHPTSTGAGSPSSSKMHSRTTSQSSAQTHQPSSSSMSSLNGNTTVQPSDHQSQPQPLAHPHLHTHTKSQTQFLQFKFPQSHSQPGEPTPATPAAARRPLAHTRSQSTLPITLSTTDGHLLAFDALQTSPGELDALEGISDSAKKQAREEMRMLVRAAVDKWTI
ncbi:hypothetical protein C8R44DRAFT_829023 [Mycena epipterygia]|nr:hypothetical protein C8R44DRAFT_829023 [Mycena epipterygia]